MRVENNSEPFIFMPYKQNASTRSKPPAGTGARRAIATLLALCGFIVGSSLSLYLWKFGELNPQEWGLSPVTSEWANFASFIGASLALSSTIITGALAVLIPRALHREADQARRLEATSRLALDFYSRDFYIEVIVPGWEIATKWLSWVGPEGDKYRVDVVGGHFLFEQEDFVTSEQANQVPFQNTIHFPGHYEDREISAAQAAGNEHMLLSTWIRFWVTLELGYENGVLDAASAQSSFLPFYRSYRHFFRQLWMVGLILDEGEEALPADWSREWHMARHGPALYHLLPRLELRLMDQAASAGYQSDRRRAVTIATHAIAFIESRRCNGQYSFAF